MNQKLPYYMAYPLPIEYDNEKREQRDFEYMKSIYPDVAKRLLPYIDEECDRMEYPCSMMYDAYPDKLQLRMMSSRIYDKASRDRNIAYLYETGFHDIENQKMAQEQDVQEMQRGMRPPHRPMPPHHPGRPDWLRDMIELMLYQELFKRRCDNRRCGRRFY